MSARIRIASLEATIDNEMSWQVRGAENRAQRHLAASLERLLNNAYGIDWLPDFGVYEPSRPNAAAQAVALDLGAEVLELEPVEEDTLEGRVY